MIKFFKKTKAVVARAISTETEVQVIEKIHNGFENAADEALAEAKRILSIPVNETEKEYGEKLRALGFTNTELANKVLKQEQVNEKQKQRAETVMRWQVKYPQYKLIFLDQVKAICEKYGLILGDVGRYKGTVPRKNIDEIAAFKIDAEDWLFQNPGYTHTIYGTTTTPFRESYGAYDGAEKGAKIPLPKCGFFICAPLKDMHVDTSEKIDSFMIAPKDPIVLMPIEEHGEAFLIVSKWGLEGNDPALVNEVQN